MSTATIALRTRPRLTLGPALRPARLPVGSLVLSAILHVVGFAVLLLLAWIGKPAPEKTYVVNLVPAIAAVGTPGGRANAPARTLPPRPSEASPTAKTSPKELPRRELPRAAATPPEPAPRPSVARELPKETREARVATPPEVPARPSPVKPLVREPREAPAPLLREMPPRPSAVKPLAREPREAATTTVPSELPARLSAVKPVPREQREAPAAVPEMPARLSTPTTPPREQREAHAVAPLPEMPARPSLRESTSSIDRNLPSHAATLPRPGDKELPPTAPLRGTGEALARRETLTPPQRAASDSLPRREVSVPPLRASEALPQREAALPREAESLPRRELPPPPARALADTLPKRDLPLPPSRGGEVVARRDLPAPPPRGTNDTPARREAPPPPPAPLGHIAGSPQGAGTVTLSVSDFPYAWYIQAIHRKIQERWEGHAMEGQQPEVIFEIGGDGRLRRLLIGKTSGNPVYDQVALRAVDDANPFPPLPTGFKKPSLTIGLQFVFDGRGR